MEYFEVVVLMKQRKNQTGKKSDKFKHTKRNERKQERKKEHKTREIERVRRGVENTLRRKKGRH